MSEQEKKDKRFSFIISAIIHSGLIALFLILVAWRQPDPPVPEYGIELNLGFQEEGSGDTERTFDAQNEDTEEDTPPDAEADTENTETEAEEQVTEETEEEVVEEQAEEQAQPETTPTEEAQEEAPPVEQTVEETVTKEEKEVVKVEEKTPPVKKSKEETAPPKVEEKKEEVKPTEEKKEEPKPKPVVDNRALMGGKKTNSDSKEEASNNQGTQTDTRGNMGDPEGKTNTKGTNPGGADLGVSYSLDGWKWQSPPADKDDSQIDGIIKFSISVDDRGKVLTVSVIPGTTISDNTIIKFYKDQVEKLKFLQTDPSKSPAAISKGEVTFVIKTN